MWEGFLTLLGFSLVMGVSSFLAGLLPLSFGLSQNHSRAISALGSGLLVGTCLIVIIPEGVETLYSAGEHYYEMRGPGDDYAGELFEPHGAISVSLVAGFILMFLIDRLPRHAAAYSQRRKPLHISLANLSQGPHHRAVSPLPGSGEEETESMITGQGGAPGGPASSGTGRLSSLLSSLRSGGTSFATTIGLVIHAIADGIALAASTFISHPRTGLVVFFALMIHKAPAAFGLTSTLTKQGLSKRQARMHLLLFSVAAPAGALATWFFVRVFIGDDVGEMATRFTTGVLLIFSGGTFLYVAMHTAHELNSEHGHGHSDSHQPLSVEDSAAMNMDGNGYANGAAEAGLAPQHQHQQHGAAGVRGGPPTFRETALGVTGMLLPLLAELGHAH